MIDQIKQIIAYHKVNPNLDCTIRKDMDALIAYIEHLEGIKKEKKQILYLIEQGESEEFAKITTDIIEAKIAKLNGKKVSAYDGIYVTDFEL